MTIPPGPDDHDRDHTIDVAAAREAIELENRLGRIQALVHVHDRLAGELGGAYELSPDELAVLGLLLFCTAQCEASLQRARIDA